MEFITKHFVPLLFGVVFGGMFMLFLSLNLYARLKRKLQLLMEAKDKGEDLQLVKVQIFPFIIRLSSLAYIFNEFPGSEERPDIYQIDAVLQLKKQISTFNKFYLVAIPLAFFLLVGMVVLAGLAG